ncbi:hypothetical protein [Streptomyces sp. TLI_171]|uniref:hypothetical protein n=1 Tax=Streptomyces sp. TLI_171 TaxID=1938859 RepID=UPI000C18F727|nr:hypothetical protein [Streptomyces sp. TLI_171]RKE23361.1 hypothetical protein BX266_6827 [Streptomyces sp. TLI_171]
MTVRTLLPPADAHLDTWGLRRAARLAFPAPAALAADPVHAERLHRYLTDLLAPYGLPLAERDLTGCQGQSYGEMAEALFRAAVPAGEQVDLLVLAHAVPDLAPGRATACWLGHLCPGRPLALAVTDEDAPTGTTALRLLEAYARSGGLRRALLLVVEQHWLPYDPGLPAPVPATSRGVALLFGDACPGEPLPRPVQPPPHPDPTHPATSGWWELAGAPGDGEPPR